MAGEGRGIALVGFMGAGKSTVGRRLAELLGWPLVDLDEALEALYGPIEAQILHSGEDAFRRREASLIVALCDGVQRILSTGGGAFVDRGSRGHLERWYTTVHLAASLQTLERRLGAGVRRRPLWDAQVAQRYHERQPLYASARLQVSTEGRTPEQIAGLILQQVHP
ncbi:MAG TPA: shikimate kinase [Deltaproteobacteria bacterium]|nr:shikimate kinase [Deltaproteobacteria bacterium]